MEKESKKENFKPELDNKVSIEIPGESFKTKSDGSLPLSSSPPEPKAMLAGKPIGKDVIEPGKVIQGPEQTPKTAMVTVPKSDLEAILARQKKQEEEIEMLKFTADKSRIDKWRQDHPEGKLVRNAKLNFWEDKVIVGWKMVKDDVWIDQRGVLHEKQTMKLFLFEGEGKEPSTAEVDYVNFSRNVIKVEGEIIKKSETSQGNISFIIQLEDGRKFEVDSKFVN